MISLTQKVALIALSALAVTVTQGAFAGHHEASEHHPQKNIVETAADAGSFNTLLTALEAANLADTLAGEGPFTVFAPTDAAFAALPEGTLEALLADPEKLKQVLTYHVVAGQVMAADVADISSATTIEGSSLAIETSADGVMVDDATVVTSDVAASNGVIHVIDAVLIPAS